MAAVLQRTGNELNEVLGAGLDMPCRKHSRQRHGDDEEEEEEEEKNKNKTAARSLVTL